ncbi:MAG: gephyrin-like molybdotransferase Glp [Desulfovibrionales bacterium]
MQEKDFFRVVSVREFLDLVLLFPPIERTETVHPAQAAGRILAQEVVAPEDLPPASRSSMDGYAVRAADTFGAGEGSPAYLETVGEIEVDTVPGFALRSGECASIVTGGTLPEGADSVVMVEYTLEMGGGTVEVRKGVAPGENMMLQGEDCVQGSTMFPAGKRLGIGDIGLLAALGMDRVTVYEQPKVFIVSTGNELVPAHVTPRPGQIRDVNSTALAAQVALFGGIPIQGALIPDDLDRISDELHKGVEQADLVLVSGGSSVGTRDLTLAAIEQLPEASVLAHGVAIKPGKPAILARVGTTPVWGLPGQVTSAQVSMLVFGLPLIRRLGGERVSPDTGLLQQSAAVLARNISSPQGKTEYVRVKLESGPDPLPRAVPILGKSGLLKTMVQADGLVEVGANREGLEAGETVRVLVFPK